MNPTDRASLFIVGVSLFLIISVGFFFQEQGIFGEQKPPSYLIVTISLEESISGEKKLLFMRMMAKIKLMPTFRLFLQLR